VPDLLPVKKKQVEQLTCKPEHKFSVLVVDDIDNNREILANLLQSCGIHVLEASNGTEAIEQLKNKKFDLAFVDLLMPVMRGDEAIKIIRNEMKMKDLVCVALSAPNLTNGSTLSVGFREY